jgi:bifunctional non-homologous end joining protein LigD
MADKLSTYRQKRSAARTPEPVPEAGPLPRGDDDTFVIQEHHARRLHWDFRLERDGVLVSWAIPKGLPDDPSRNHLAVHTEDHPLEYAAFEGDIPRGEYGAGPVTIWDRGTYVCEKWNDREVMVVLHGQRSHGRFVLFQTDGRNWMIHRMGDRTGGSAAPAAQPLPELIRPMLATLGDLPTSTEDGRFGYESKWDGVRAVVYVENGRVRVMTRNDLDVTRTYPELAGLGESLGGLPVVLDGEIVAFDPDRGGVSFAALQARMHVQNTAQIRRLVEQVPVTYRMFDLLYLDGHRTTELSYRERRELLDGLGLRGPHWDTPPYVAGGGADALAASKRDGLEGIVAKRLDSAYEPGRRSRAWIKVKNVATQEIVIGGWTPGKGRRAGTVGSLLMGIPNSEGGLEFVGGVGTGFTQPMLDDLYGRLRGLERKTSPFAQELPARDRKDARWVSPRLVGEVTFGQWTRDGRLRHPAWRGLRSDKSAAEVTRQT